jgi:hypothetical protein
MSRLNEIKERLALKKHARTLCNAPIKFADQPYNPFRQDEKDIEYLLGEVERLQAEIKRLKQRVNYVRDTLRVVDKYAKIDNTHLWRAVIGEIEGEKDEVLSNDD